jgi:hypothetical protein
LSYIICHLVYMAALRPLVRCGSVAGELRGQVSRRT